MVIIVSAKVLPCIFYDASYSLPLISTWLDGHKRHKLSHCLLWDVFMGSLFYGFLACCQYVALHVLILHSSFLSLLITIILNLFLNYYRFYCFMQCSPLLWNYMFVAFVFAVICVSLWLSVGVSISSLILASENAPYRFCSYSFHLYILLYLTICTWLSLISIINPSQLIFLSYLPMWK